MFPPFNDIVTTYDHPTEYKEFVWVFYNRALDQYIITFTEKGLHYAWSRPCPYIHDLLVHSFEEHDGLYTLTMDVCHCPQYVLDCCMRFLTDDVVQSEEPYNARCDFQ